VIQRLESAVPLDEVIARYLGDVELVLVEGYRELRLPKIEVVREGEELLCPPDQLVAVVGEDRPALGVPCFGAGDIAKVADFLEGMCFRARA